MLKKYKNFTLNKRSDWKTKYLRFKKKFRSQNSKTIYKIVIKTPSNNEYNKATKT